MYFSRVDVAVGERHGHVILVHDFPTYPAYNCRVGVMTKRYLFCQFTQPKPLGSWPCFSIAYRTIDILCRWVIAYRKFKRCETSIQRKVEKGFTGQHVQRVDRNAKQFDKILPSWDIIETLMKDSESLQVRCEWERSPYKVRRMFWEGRLTTQRQFEFGPCVSHAM